LPRKSGAAKSRAAFAASLKMLSSNATGVVHAFYDMDEMPISQWFFESTVERARRARSRVSMCASISSRCVAATCRDAAGANRYTFR
jgi:hypothetical protein